MKVNLLDGLNNKVLMSCENAMLSSTSDSGVNGKTRALIEKDNSIHFIANTIESKVFNYMLNSLGEIVSYRNYYGIPSYCDEFIKAIYSDSAVEAKSLINWIGKGYDIDANTNTIYFYIICDVLETKVDWHLLVSTKGISDDEMIVGTAGLGDFTINYKPTDPYCTVRFAFTNAKSFKEHRTLKARAYSTIEKDGVEEIIYSNVITVQL